MGKLILLIVVFGLTGCRSQVKTERRMKNESEYVFQGERLKSTCRELIPEPNACIIRQIPVFTFTPTVVSMVRVVNCGYRNPG